MVEAVGIEPTSGNPQPQASTSIAGLSYCSLALRPSIRQEDRGASLICLALPLRRSSEPAGAGHRARRLIHLTALVALTKRGALVVQLLAAAQPQFDLGAAVLEVESKRNQREAALGDLAGQAADFLAVQQQLPVAVGVVVRVGAVTVGIDMAAHEPALAVADRRVRILEVHAPVAPRLDLGPSQHEPGPARLQVPLPL